MKINSKLIILTTVVLTIVLGLFYVMDSSRFKLKSLSPGLNNIITSTPYIDIAFNQKLANDSSQKFSSPQNIVTKTIIDGNKARLYFGSLEDKKEYHIKIQGLKSQSGAIISYKDLKFKPKYVDFENLSENQRKVLLESENDQKGNISDPILTSLPYGGLHFKLDAYLGQSTPTDKITLKAQILLSKADLIDETTAVKSYKTELMEYINSLGLDPNNYNIEYETVQPSLY